MGKRGVIVSWFCLLGCSARSTTSGPVDSDVPAVVDLPLGFDLPPGVDLPLGADGVSACGAASQACCIDPGGVARCFGELTCNAGVCGTPAPRCVPAPTGCGTPSSVDGRTPYYECSDAPVCPACRVANDATRPAWRITYFAILQPSALSNAALQSGLVATLQRGGLAWGLRLDLTARTFETGAFNPATTTRGSVGLGLLDAQYRFYHDDAADAVGASRYNPVTGALTVTGDRVTTEVAAGPLRVPFFNVDGSTLLTLPLSNVRVSQLQLTADRGCVGTGRVQSGRFSESTSAWNTTDAGDAPYALIDGDIAVALAREVNISLGGSTVTLCELLAGVSCTRSMSTWARQPDASVDGAPAFHFRATLAAVSATVR